MSQTTQPAYQAGELVTQVSMQAVQDAMRNEVGSAIAGILGISSANLMDVPFTVTASGGMVVHAGGTGGEKILANSSSGPRLIDAIPSQDFTVPTADVTNPRHDIIYGKYAQTQVLSSTTGQIATISGGTVTVSTGDIYNATEALTYTYATGTPASSPSDPSGPSGSVALARIVVAANSTSISSGNITLLLTTAQNQILSGIAGYVDLTSNQTVGGNKNFTGVTTVGGIQFANTDTAFSGVVGIRRNIPNSIVISPSSPGNGIYLGYDCLTLASVNFGPSNNWGYVGPDGFHSPGNNSIFGTNVTITAGQIHVGSSTNPIGQAGDGIFERNGPSGVVYLGNSSSAFLYYTGTAYVLGGGPSGSSALDINGSLSTTGPITYLNLGNQTINGLIIGNNTFSDGQTGIGSRGAAINGISPGVLNIENIGHAQLFTLDGAGNVGIPGGLYAAYVQSSGDMLVSGKITLGGAQVVNSYVSDDFSVNLSQTGSQLHLTLPGGFINSFSSSDSSVNHSQSGRSLDLTLPGGFVSSFVSDDSSINISQSGRQLHVELSGTYRSGTVAPVYSPTGSIISSGMKIVTGQNFISSGTVTTITLAGNAIFSSAGTYQVTADSIYGVFPLIVQVNNINGSSFTLTVYELSGGGWSSGSAPNVTVSWIAIGY